MAVTSLPLIQQALTRYGMTTYFALGLVGNICNCIMFTRRSYRHQPSSIYFISLSIFAIIILTWSFIPIFYGFNHIDPQTQSLVYCKIRFYGTLVSSQLFRYTVVLACFDRFFATRTNIRIRSLHSVQKAKKFVLIICVIWIIASIHIPIFMELNNSVCGMFGVYKLFFSIYQIIFVAVLPPILMSIFSALTIHSLHRQHATQVRFRQRDRYLLRMVISEVLINILTTIPYSSNLIYSIIASYVVNKSAQRLEIESFINFFTQFIVYLMSVVPFYLFIATSKPFRYEFINIIVTCWSKFMPRQIRITPSNGQVITAALNVRTINDRQ
ncbi:unnamed protein product [Adineta steineri]|uniref:G-protein coupled receptors family 1 profile domain-containing protein n=1 Tax=Adineta steineri TaxID=433720 RepID=A0A815MNN3_9BILA|nr:unnamed protein product [Adineta steineri]CAF1620049.1 unnamed protein product [Adineta steineri]